MCIRDRVRVALPARISRSRCSIMESSGRETCTKQARTKPMARHAPGRGFAQPVRVPWRGAERLRGTALAYLASGSMSDTVLEARRITKVYGMGEVEVQALRGVDFHLDEGELLVLLGASGSGKSTLLNILGGLDVASDGMVRYRGVDLSGADEAELTTYRRDHVGFVFQF